MAEHTVEETKNRRFVNTGFRVTHSTNEDLLSIKRKGHPRDSIDQPICLFDGV